jgi:hypothetical protein
LAGAFGASVLVSVSIMLCSYGRYDAHSRVVTGETPVLH